MRYYCLATDYDGTLARDGVTEPATVRALERLKESGRRLVLVTGRELDDLVRSFPAVALFDRVVAENGAVLFDPATGAERALADPPPASFGDALAAAGVSPLSRGRVIVATGQPHEVTAIRLIREHGLELQVVFNKGAVMILPTGVNKATGLDAALAELGLSRFNTVGVGDAENDHAFLSRCGCSVAVSGAIPALRERADLVTDGDAGVGVEELCGRLTEHDLADIEPSRLRVPLGGAEPALSLSPFGPPLLIAGSSGGGKSTFASGLLERMAEAGHQFCLIDPEGDYGTLSDVLTLGSTTRAPEVAEIMEALERPDQNVAVNLLGHALSERPAFFSALHARLHDLRLAKGRPHWLVVDEAHHVLGASRETGLGLPLLAGGAILITVEPAHVSRAVLAQARGFVALGRSPADTLRAFSAAVGEEAPSIPEMPADDGRSSRGFYWTRGTEDVRIFEVWPAAVERRRHRRKYAEGDMGLDRSFYFRGPEATLNLRAGNLVVFADLAAGVDERTWEFHLRRGDVSRWVADCVKDDELATAIASVAVDEALSVGDARQRVIDEINSRYTAPA